MPAPVVPKKLPEFLRPHESAALVRAAGASRNAARDRLILLLGLAAGLRCAEILHLRMEHLDLTVPQLAVRGGKGGKDRFVALPAFLAAELRAWVGAAAEGWLFPSPKRAGRPLTTRAVRYLAARLRAAAGVVRRANPHVWRHSYACELLRTGALLTEIQQLLGHSSIAVTSVYLHCDAARLQPAVERLTNHLAENSG